MKDNLPVQKNQQIELTIDALLSDGQGVGRYENFAVFVNGALPGEQVRALIIKTTPSYAVGKLLDILDQSEARTEPACPVYRQCGGCQLQHMNYEAQLAFKEKQVADALTRIGKLQAIKIERIIPSDMPWRYRGKSAFPVGAEAGKTKIGYFSPRSHRIVDVERCLIQHESGDAVIKVVRGWMEKHSIPPYDEATHKGALRHIITRHTTTGEDMAILVTNGRALPHADELIVLLLENIPDLQSIIQNINTRRDNVILGSESITLWGKDEVTEEIAGLRFRISPNSFFQVNVVQAEKLYRKALEYANPGKDDVIVDAYCGTGTISLFLARAGGKVYGIESVPEAIEDAKKNAELNGITNAEFICDTVEDGLAALLDKGIKPDIIVLDPPRKGCEPSAIEAILKSGAKRVVYVSCNPATLARDAAMLAEGGYTAEAVTPVDMFPNTSHTECCCLLERTSSVENKGI